MSGTAGFLRILSTIVLVFLVIGIALVALSAVVLAVAPGILPESLADGALAGVTLNGQPATLEAILAVKNTVLVVLGAALVELILETVSVSKVRTALGEVRDEKPFSEKCSKALSGAAVIQIICAVLMIVESVVLTFVAKDFAVENLLGTGIGNSLSLIILAVFYMMLSKISEFGRKSL